MLVPPAKNHTFQQFIKSHGIEDQIQIDNVQKLIDEEEKRLAHRSIKRVDWTDYNTVEEVSTI